MQAKEIIGLIKGETDYTEETLYSLKNLVEKYPYFQAAQLLFTLNLHIAKDSRFNAELRKAACHLGDRQNLFYRVKSDSFPREWIEKMERKEEPVTSSSSELVDIFLTKQESKENESLPENVFQRKVSTDYLSTLSEMPDDAKAEIIPLRHQDTIDKFLAKDKESPVKIVLKNQPEEESDLPFFDLNTVEKGDFISETLAKIYLKQKKYEKALEIIRKLYLLYPEKNRYFADQIRFLEILVNNTKKTE